MTADYQGKSFTSNLKNEIGKKDVKKIRNMDIKSWESSAVDRNLWRSIARDGTVTFEFKRSAKLEEKAATTSA